MILYIENPKSYQKITRANQKIQQSRGIQGQYTESTSMKNQKEKLRNKSHSPLQQKELIF